jgi:alpha-1,2-mannosyltransferase
MKAVVIHHSLNSPGGEATVAIETIQSLYELGYEVDLISIQKLDLEEIAKSYGKRIAIRNVNSLLPFKLNYFGIYQRLLTTISSLSVKDSDIIINTNGTTFPYKISSDNIPCILYIHFPTLLLTSAYYNNNKYQKSLFWKMYFKPYQVMANILTKKALATSRIILTNSRFTRDAVREAYPDIDPHILHPPVDIDRFSLAYRSHSRERQVLVVSRFSPEKQIENAIRVAKLLGGNINFEIIGSLLPANKLYFNSLQKMIQDYGLENKVRLTPNATNEELLDAMSTSTVYLHTMYGEHFGVSIVEAMAAGLVPVIPSYGGCSEVAPVEYQYNTIEEAADCISRNIDNYDSQKRQCIHDIARQFSPSIFRKKMQQYIEQVLKNDSSSNDTSTNITSKSSTYH